MRKHIIIFCCENDEHAIKVKSLIPENFEPVLLEREKYGTNWNITGFTKINKIDVVITENNRTITLKEINSIFLRRDFTIESQDISGNYTEGEKKYIATQRAIHINSCIKYLARVIPTINTPDANYASLSKILQIDIAQKVGLKVPQSFFGGSFEKSNINTDEQLCIKPLEGVHLKEGQKTYAHYAELLEDKTKETLKTLEFCPAIIQNYIPKVYELRITVVGNKIFPCKIESQKSNIGNIDWRHHDWENTPHYKVDIPFEIKDKILFLMHKLKLSYGAIDMIFDGKDYYFLEVNSMGQWLWIEDFTEMPISKSIAELLSFDYSQNLVFGGILRHILPEATVIPGTLQKITSENLHAIGHGDSALIPRNKTECIICNEPLLNRWVNYDHRRSNLFCNSHECLDKYNALISNE